MYTIIGWVTQMLAKTLCSKTRASYLANRSARSSSFPICHLSPFPYCGASLNQTPVLSFSVEKKRKSVLSVLLLKESAI